MRTCRGGRARDDRGAATVWAAAGVSCLMAVSLFLLAVGTATVARHRAAAAADLAALAAAAHRPGGPGGCRAARLVAERMGAEVVSCRFHGADALVTLTVVPPAPLAGLGRATGRARAGPASWGATNGPRG